MSGTAPALGRADVVLTRPHDDLGDDTYHEWITLGSRLLLDGLGRPNPRMWGPKKWTEWICNNTECEGRVLVHDDAVRGLVTEAVDART